MDETHHTVDRPHTVFVHIPKTGGSSIRQMFRASHGDDNVSLSTDQGSIIRDMDSAKYNHFFGHVGMAVALNYALRQKTIIFTFLRSPVDRILSLYNFFHNLDPKKYGGDFVIRSAMENEIEEFILSTDPRIISYLDNTQVWQLAIAADADTRSKFAHLSDDDLVGLARKNVSKIHFAGVVESMERCSTQLGQILGMDLGIQHVNKSNSRFVPRGFAAKEAMRRYTELDEVLYDYVKSRFDSYA